MAKASNFVDDYRRCLIHLTNIGKQKGIIWQDLAKVYERAKMTEKEFFFIHCRDANDFAKIKEIIPDVITLLVWREGIEPSNEQDAAIPTSYNYDIVLQLPNINEFGYKSTLESLYKQLSEEN